MLRMLRMMKKNTGWILLVFALLVLQAWCDLSLPDYTSRIVDTGLQQKGVEDALPRTIRRSSMEKLLLLMNEKDSGEVRSIYREEGEIYRLDEADPQERGSLEGKMAGAEMLLMAFEKQGVDILALPSDQVRALAGQIEAKVKEYPDSMRDQAAIRFVQDEYIAQGIDLDRMQTDYLKYVGLRMLIMAGLSTLAAILVGFIASRICAMLGYDLRSRVYRRVMSFSNQEMNHFSTASLITRSTNDIQQVQLVMTIMFRIILYAPILAVGGIVKVSQTSSYLQWILVVGVALLMSVMLVLFIFVMPRFKILQTLVDRINLVSREILTGLPVIRAFGTERHEEERFEAANRDLMKTNLFVNRAMAFMMPVMMLLMNGISVLIIYSGAHGIDEGRIQVGDMMAFIQYAMQIIMSFLMISAVAIFMPRASVSARRIHEVLDTEPTIRDPLSPAAVKGRGEELVFDHVSFRYPGAAEDVLSDISFRVKKGETLAIIGSTGSGKSTIVNLIPRFFDVTEGAIRIAGRDIREMSLEDLRGRIGLVPQKSVLFSGTIASNLRFGAESADEDRIQRALRIAQAADFVTEKEEGIESDIAQGGSNVSGGQKQRLAIARAVVKAPDFYVFDDSFSALDFQTDAALRRALRDAAGDAAVILVAQRVSTIMQADRILVLEAGSMAGMGTHEELMRDCEIYRQIAESQLSLEEV